MLKEIINVRQIEGEHKRRWFQDDFFDLIVWFTEDEEISGFQLCYNIPSSEKALTWTNLSGFTHLGVDTGDYSPVRNDTPILVPDGFFDKVGIDRRFLKDSAEIDPKISTFVHQKIEEYAIYDITDATKNSLR